MFHEREQTMQCLTGYRADPLSDSNVALRERKPFRFRTGSRRPLDERLRYATQTEVACDRFLLAHLSGLQSGHLFGELMKDFCGPAITPGLKNATTLPMQRVGQQKAGRITSSGRFMLHDLTLPAVAFEPDDFGKDPVVLALDIATPHRHRAETLWVLLLEGGRHRVDAAPLPIPLNVAGAFHFTDPVFPRMLQEAGEV